MSSRHRESNPDDYAIRKRFADVHSLLAKCLLGQGTHEEAIEIGEAALADVEAWRDYSGARGDLLQTVSDCYYQVRDFERARSTIEESIEISRRVRDAYGPSSPQVNSAAFLYRLYHLARIHLELGAWETTGPLWFEMLTVQEGIRKHDPDFEPKAEMQRMWAVIPHMVGIFLMRDGQLEDAEEQLRASLREMNHRFGMNHGMTLDVLEHLLVVLEVTRQLDEANRMWRDYRDDVHVDANWELNAEGPAVEYRLRISEPGEYQLFVHWGVDEGLYRKNKEGRIAASLHLGEKRLEDWYQLERFHPGTDSQTARSSGRSWRPAPQSTSSSGTPRCRTSQRCMKAA